MTGRRIGDPTNLVGHGDTPTIGAPRPIGRHDQPDQSQALAPLMLTTNLLLQKVFGNAGGKGMPYTKIEVNHAPIRGQTCVIDFYFHAVSVAYPAGYVWAFQLTFHDGHYMGFKIKEYDAGGTVPEWDDTPFVTGESASFHFYTNDT